MTGMRSSWLVMLVAVYVSLDVANPLMPGALTFGVGDSVEVRQAERFRGHDDAALVPAMPLFEQGERQATAVSRAPVGAVPPGEPQQMPRARSSLPTRSAPSPDH